MISERSSSYVLVLGSYSRFPQSCGSTSSTRLGPKYVSRSPVKAIHHNVALCISYIDLIDGDRLEKETGIKWKKPTSNYSDLFVERPVTINQVFKYTPDAGDAIDSCTIRTNDWVFQPLLRNDCSKSFNVSKFLTLEFMCYSIQPQNHHNIDLRYVTQSLFLQFTMFEVGLTSIFAVAKYINLIVFTGNYPFISRDFSSFTTLTSAPEAPNKTNNYLNVFSSDYSIKQLPAPFDTACHNLSVDDRFLCKYECLLHRYKLSKMMPANIIIPDLPDYRILAYKDLHNPELLALVSKNDRECHTKCSFNPCLQQYTKTTIDPVYWEGSVLTLGMRSPIDPDIDTEAKPVMHFVELFCFLCSCSGAWFGISFLSMNPLQYSLFGFKKKSTNKSKLTAIVAPSSASEGTVISLVMWCYA